MSECTLAHTGEFTLHGIGVNGLWLRTTLAAAAGKVIAGSGRARWRIPAIFSCAAYLFVTSNAKIAACNFISDDELLLSHGVTVLRRHGVTSGTTDRIPQLLSRTTNACP